MRLVNDERSKPLRVELRHAPATIPTRALRLDRRDDHPRQTEETAVGLVFAHLHVRFEARDAFNLVPRLKDEFFPVRDHQRPAGKNPPDDIRKENGLPAARRDHDQRGVMLQPFLENGAEAAD